MDVLFGQTGLFDIFKSCGAGFVITLCSVVFIAFAAVFVCFIDSILHEKKSKKHNGVASDPT